MNQDFQKSPLSNEDLEVADRPTQCSERDTPLEPVAGTNLRHQTRALTLDSGTNMQSSLRQERVIA